MRGKHWLPLLALSMAVSLPSCESIPKLSDNQQFIADTVIDSSLAWVVYEHPEFSPYAFAIGEIVQTRGLSPDTLDKALDQFITDNVDLESQKGVNAVVGVLKLTYRRYYNTEQTETALEVVITNEDLQESLASSLQPPLPRLEQPLPPGPSK